MFLPNCSSSSVVGLENWFNKSSLSSILRIAEMHLTSLHVGYPRSPFKFPAFTNALLFLCHTSGLKLFPGGSILLRPSSNVGLYSRYLLQPSTNAGPLPSSNVGMYPSSSAELYIRAPTPDCIRAPTPDYIRGVVNHLGSKKFEGV